MDESCHKCIFPEKCVNFGKEFCKTKSADVKFEFTESEAGTKVKLSEDYKCSSECFICKFDTTCLVSDRKKEIK